MNMGTWLLAMMQPLVARVLIAIGFSVVSIAGMDTVLSGMKTLIVGDLQSLPASMLNLVLYFWLGKALGVLFGAATTKLAIWAIGSATTLAGKAP